MMRKRDTSTPLLSTGERYGIDSLKTTEEKDANKSQFDSRTSHNTSAMMDDARDTSPVSQDAQNKAHWISRVGRGS